MTSTTRFNTNHNQRHVDYPRDPEMEAKVFALVDGARRGIDEAFGQPGYAMRNPSIMAAVVRTLTPAILGQPQNDNL